MMSNNWERVRLGDYIKVKHGFAFKGEFIDTEINNKILVTPGNFKIGGGFKEDKCKYYNGEIPEEYILKQGEVIVTMTDLSKAGDTLGYSALVPNDNEKIYLHNQRIGLIQFKNNNIDRLYLYWRLRNYDYQKSIVASSTGTTVKHTSPTKIENFEFSLPPMETQEKIANILSSLDDKIENNKKTAVKLEEIAQTIFQRWFVEFNFPDENGLPYKDNGGEMVESELGLIPKGWEVGTLGDIVKLNTKSVKPFENPDVLYEHYSIPSLDDGDFPKFEMGIDIKSNKYEVKKNSIMISKLNPKTKRIWYPICLTDNCICSTEFMNYIPKEIIYKNFAYAILDSDEFSNYLVNHSTGSTNSRQRAKPKESLYFKVSLPIDRKFCRCFDAIAKPIYEKMILNKVEVKRLSIIRDALIPKLMSGEIEV